MGLAWVQYSKLPSPVGGRQHPGQGLNATKGRGRVIPFLHDGPGLLVSSCPETGISVSGSPAAQAFGLPLNDTTSSPGSPACRWQIMDSSASITA